MPLDGALCPMHHTAYAITSGIRYCYSTVCSVIWLQLQASAPLLLLPVVPELKALLRHDDEPQRAAAVALLCRLLAAPPQDAAVGAAQQPQPMSPGLVGAAVAAAGPHPGAATSLATQYPDLFDVGDPIRIKAIHCCAARN